jgi:hypothetical protein
MHDASGRSEPPARASAHRPLVAPLGANLAAWCALLLASTAFSFASYAMARALAGGFGGPVATVVLSSVATVGASIFLWWLAPLADFAEIAWIHLPADRRARRGACPRCGYLHSGRATCTECGEPTAPLPAWTLSRRPVRRFGAILAVALVLGGAAGEAWSRLDERRFAEEAATAARPYSRPRAFPAGFARMTAAADGTFASEAWPDDARDRRWQPQDESLRNRGLGWRDGAAE